MRESHPVPVLTSNGAASLGKLLDSCGDASRIQYEEKPRRTERVGQLVDGGKEA